MFAQELKRRVAARELTVGVLISFDFWPGYIEIFKRENVDYAVLDMEHSTCDLRTAEDLCRTARLLEFPLLIRPEASVHHLVKKYMDVGASGLMMPWTESMAHIETMRDAVFTPPLGRRGPGGPAIFANRSLDRQGWDEVESSFFLMYQVESQAGMRGVQQFAAANWVDATMLGPYDLSLNLSLWGQLTHPDLIEAIRQIRRDSEAVGKPCGMVCGSPEMANFWINDGFPLMLIPDPSYLAQLQLKSFLSALREQR